MTLQAQDRQGLRHGELDSGKRKRSCNRLHVASIPEYKSQSLIERYGSAARLSKLAREPARRSRYERITNVCSRHLCPYSAQFVHSDLALEEWELHRGLILKNSRRSTASGSTCDVVAPGSPAKSYEGKSKKARESVEDGWPVDRGRDEDIKALLRCTRRGTCPPAAASRSCGASSSEAREAEFMGKSLSYLNC